MVGNLELYCPLTPFNTPGIKSLAGVAIIGLVTVPGKLPNGVVGTTGAVVTFVKGRRMPATRMLSARIRAGDA